MQLRLRRFTQTGDATVGELVGLGKKVYTLEDPWRNNTRMVSCIPVGTYNVVPHGWEPDSTVRFKRTYRLLNVPGRTAILIHAGNSHADTHGCILLGFGLTIDQGLTTLTESRAAVDLLRQTIGQGNFTIKIEE